ncbi:CPBP family intramembrane metalloprotease [candidate division KSB1 bacterium]|nr:CPBP family intramembrane metalloprotease [candidate division KSB1 bacterium]
MKKSIHIKCFVFICLFLLPIVAEAQDEITSEGLSRAQVLKYPLISTALSIATVTGIGRIDSADLANYKTPWWLDASIATQHLPIYQLDKQLGMRYSLIEGGFLAAHYATKSSSPTITGTALNLYLKTAYYSTYDMYKIARGRAQPGIYTDEWRGYGVKELSFAPFQLKNILQPIFLIPVGLITWGQINQIQDSDTSIFKTKQAYIDGNKYSLGQAIPMMIGNNMLHYLATAIGEEVLYRGVIYEELKVSFGSKRAKLYDFFIFPAIHVPMDIAARRDLDYIIGQFIQRGVATLLFDFAYDKGGLPLSVSLHTWFNFINFTTNWMRDGGVPDTDPTDNTGTSVSVMPPLTISFTIYF